jgi:hypothetical protein
MLMRRMSDDCVLCYASDIYVRAVMLGQHVSDRTAHSPLTFLGLVLCLRGVGWGRCV